MPGERTGMKLWYFGDLPWIPIRKQPEASLRTERKQNVGKRKEGRQLDWDISQSSFIHTRWVNGEFGGIQGSPGGTCKG